MSVQRVVVAAYTCRLASRLVFASSTLLAVDCSDRLFAPHADDYLNTRCNENLLSCLDGVSPAGPTFPGNECDVGQTASVIRGVIESAVLAGKILHKRDDGQ